jgi:hypothetical protein
LLFDSFLFRSKCECFCICWFAVFYLFIQQWFKSNYYTNFLLHNYHIITFLKLKSVIQFLFHFYFSFYRQTRLDDRSNLLTWKFIIRRAALYSAVGELDHMIIGANSNFKYPLQIQVGKCAVVMLLLRWRW